ncbi:MAG: ComEC/Rec2 family competence protein [Psychroserpens sp.]|uniref:ComEC/Rec2 family competence protein n=1 Tax=Psychroserpens sp. TaxID=2020870 RepID=UPI003C9881E0
MLGILLSHYFQLPFTTAIYSTLAVLSLFVLCYVIARSQFQKTIWFGLTSYLMLMSLGVLTNTFHNQKNQETHYTHVINTSTETPQLLIFKVRERLKPSFYHDKYIVDLISAENQRVSGKLLLNIHNDILMPKFRVDDILASSTTFEVVKAPLNPYQFDYNAYLEKRYIFHQLLATSKTILKLDTQQRSLKGYANDLRELINDNLKIYNFKPAELAIINAILLGQRQDMGNAIYKQYVDAGAIHILAVSGLHVGIVLILLNILLKPIETIRHGKIIKVILIVLLLWAFAVIAGLSASVTRAVTMFSIVAIAMNWKRPTNIYNTLAISIFLLLLCQPMFLFDVGFQMSYMAVLSIVSIQPLLYKLWKPNWKAIDYVWQIFTVTIAAQFGVVPISLYYFHQFPGLFFVTNLAIIPFLGFILGFGILIIVLALCNVLPQFFATLYGNIISLMNLVVNWVAQQDVFVLKAISFDLEHVLVCYFLILTSIAVFKKFNFRRVSLFLIAILLVQGAWMYSDYKHRSSSLTIFHNSRKTLIGLKSNHYLKVAHSQDSFKVSEDRMLKTFATAHFIKHIETDSLKSVYLFQDNIILMIDSLGVYNTKSFKPDIVLLRNSPRINLDRVIDSIHPKIIIADGSNYKSYIKRWEATCLKRKLPFHQTGKNGAFIIN